MTRIDQPETRRWIRAEPNREEPTRETTKIAMLPVKSLAALQLPSAFRPLSAHTHELFHDLLRLGFAVARNVESNGPDELFEGALPGDASSMDATKDSSRKSSRPTLHRSALRPMPSEATGTVFHRTALMAGRVVTASRLTALAAQPPRNSTCRCVSRSPAGRWPAVSSSHPADTRSWQRSATPVTPTGPVAAPTWSTISLQCSG